MAVWIRDWHHGQERKSLRVNTSSELYELEEKRQPEDDHCAQTRQGCGLLRLSIRSDATQSGEGRREIN